MILYVVSCCHDDIIKWKHFSRYWPFVRGIHRSPVNSPHTGQWHGALMFSLICAWMNGWLSSREAGDLRCHCAHYDVTVMVIDHVPRGFCCTGYVNHKYLAVQFQYMQDLCLWNLVIIAPSDPVKKPHWDISKGLLWQVTWVLEEPMMATVLHQECRGNGLGCRGVKTMRWLRCITVMSHEHHGLTKHRHLNRLFNSQVRLEICVHDMYHGPGIRLWEAVQVGKEGCYLNSTPLGQNGRHFTDDMLKCIFLNENIWISNKISLKYVPWDLIDNV